MLAHAKHQNTASLLPILRLSTCVISRDAVASGQSISSGSMLSDVIAGLRPQQRHPPTRWSHHLLRAARSQQSPPVGAPGAGSSQWYQARPAASFELWCGEASDLFDRRDPHQPTTAALRLGSVQCVIGASGSRSDIVEQSRREFHLVVVAAALPPTRFPSTGGSQSLQ